MTVCEDVKHSTMCDKFTIVLIEELLISGKLDGKVTKILV